MTEATVPSRGDPTPFDESAAWQGPAAPESARANNRLPEPSVLDSVKALWSDLRGLLHDQLELVALETRRAGHSLVAMVAFGIVVGILVVSAWLGLVAVLVVWMISAGLGPILALLIAVGVNLLGAFGFVLAIRRKSHHLTYPATRRSLHSDAGLPAATPAATEPP